ncbi:MAG: hypothetical protein QOJ49_1215 [Actinomycetota bacterium]|nr:hypothetical protein [Actinomycetota bacterium]
MTAPTSPIPGYYPDPSGPASLRWWDGQRWTEHAVPTAGVVLPPVAQPVSAYAWSVPPPAPRQRLRPRHMVLIAVASVVVLSLLAAGMLWGNWAQPDSSATGDHPLVAASAPPATAPPATAPLPATSASAIPGARGVVTTAEAESVFRAFWPRHERALVAHDLGALQHLDAGAAADYERGALACGCLHLTGARPMLALEFFVRRQSRYPANFVVEAETSQGGPPEVEIFVFRKAAAGAPWLVIQNSRIGAEDWNGHVPGHSLIPPDGYALPPSKAQHAKALGLARALAAEWQRAKETGRVPSRSAFQLSGRTAGRMQQIAAFPQDTEQANGLLGHATFYVDPRDPLVEVNENGVDLACQPVRETMVYRPHPGKMLVQDPARSFWGTLLAPGRYSTVTKLGSWQTCFRIDERAAGPVAVLNHDTDGGIPTATLPVGTPV